MPRPARRRRNGPTWCLSRALPLKLYHTWLLHYSFSLSLWHSHCLAGRRLRPRAAVTRCPLLGTLRQRLRGGPILSGEIGGCPAHRPRPAAWPRAAVLRCPLLGPLCRGVARPRAKVAHHPLPTSLKRGRPPLLFPSTTSSPHVRVPSAFFARAFCPHTRTPHHPRLPSFLLRRFIKGGKV